MAVQQVNLGPKKVFSVHKGLLHRHLNIPEDQKIPTARLKKAEHSSDPATRREAISAEGFRHMHHGKRKLFGG